MEQWGKRDESGDEEGHMVGAAGDLALVDPLHLEGWEEQDEPLATDPHSDEQAYCYYALRYLLNPDGHYVSKDRWLRMDPANERDKLLPDLLIALGAQDRQWGVDEYLPWEVGKPPEALAEFLSPSSEDADKEGKPKRYAELGVLEYFLFDPDGTYGVPRVQGWTLGRDGSRRPLPSDREGGVTSRVLPVRFAPLDDHIGVFDARSGQPALRYEDLQRLLAEEAAARSRAEEARERAEAARQQEAAARQREAVRRAAAEAEAARLRAELDRLRRGERGER
jgi:Uma2 family endonuclease